MVVGSTKSVSIFLVKLLLMRGSSRYRARLCSRLVPSSGTGRVQGLNEAYLAREEDVLFANLHSSPSRKDGIM